MSSTWSPPVHAPLYSWKSTLSLTSPNLFRPTRQFVNFIETCGIFQVEYIQQYASKTACSIPPFAWDTIFVKYFKYINLPTYRDIHFLLPILHIFTFIINQHWYIRISVTEIQCPNIRILKYLQGKEIQCPNIRILKYRQAR